MDNDAKPEQINDQPPISDQPKISFVKKALKFIIKHKVIFGVITALIAILIALFSFIPVVSINNVVYVDLGTKFTLNVGQTANVKYHGISLSIDHFINETCPTDRKCFGPAKAVEYDLTVDAKLFTINSTWKENGSGYNIETISTDYSSNATIIITKSHPNN